MTQGIPTLTVPAYAKINLTLEVLGRYEDGYHQIVSVMQLLDLHDTLSFEPSKELKLICDIPDLCTESNLVLKAARLLHTEGKSQHGALIKLRKTIPMDSGLGGGSSDAAATLMALNDLWELHLSAERLGHMASMLGSDVTFFLNGSTALATGRGETITPLPPPQKSWIVLLRPPMNVTQKTRQMYARLQRHHWTTGSFAQRIIEFLERGEGISPALCYNVFEEVAFSFFTGLEECRQAFQDSGAASVHLAGAGPTLYTVTPSRVEAERIMSHLAGNVYLAETLNRRIAGVGSGETSQ